MKKNPIPPADAAELRRRAEERLKEKKRGSQGAGEEVQRSAEETQRLVQELQVHQIKMEMQNEELRQSRAEVETLLGQYKDLYDFAPVGYVTLDRIGTTRRVNLTGTALLGEEVLQEALEKYRSLAAYVDSMYLVDRDCTYLFMNAGHLERFGLSLEEVIGKRHSEFHSEEDSRQFAEDVGEICRKAQDLA